MRQEERALVQETKALIKEVEAGDTDHAAWVAIQDRLKQLADGRSNREVGRLVGKSESWVQKTVTWNPYHGTLPQGGPRKLDSNERSSARKVLRDPARRQKVVESLTQDERDELRQDIYEQDEREFQGDPKAQKAHKRHQDQTKEQAARAATRRAFTNLGDRIHYYGDIPLNEMEDHEVGLIKRMADSLARGAEMDDDLRELLNEYAK